MSTTSVLADPLAQNSVCWYAACGEIHLGGPCESGGGPFGVSMAGVPPTGFDSIVEVDVSQSQPEADITLNQKPGAEQEVKLASELVITF